MTVLESPRNTLIVPGGVRNSIVTPGRRGLSPGQPNPPGPGGGGGGNPGKGKGGRGGGGILDQELTSKFFDLTLLTDKVATVETTTSTSMANLATVGPDVTMNSGVTQDQIIFFCSSLDNSGTNWSYTNVSIAGAAPDATRDMYHNGTISESNGSGHIHVTGQTDNATHTQKYMVNAGTGTFYNRAISGVAL